MLRNSNDRPPKRVINCGPASAGEREIGATLEHAPRKPEFQRAQRMLDSKDVQRITKLSRRAIHDYVLRGTFPAPIRFEGRILWIESEIAEWQERLRKQRSKGSHE